MINQTTIDLLALIEQDITLKRVASTGGGEYAGSCPFCKGTNRFRVWPNDSRPHFWCRRCDRKGDAIDYIQLKKGYSFREACTHLGIQLEEKGRFYPAAPLRRPIPSRQNLPGKLKREYPALTDANWQKAAAEFTAFSQEMLMSEAGQRARWYLNQRGLPDEIILAQNLGYNPIDRNTNWGNTSVWLPRGIVIPSWIGGKIWRISIRLPAEREGQRYIQPKGCANGLYNVDAITMGCNVIMTEGEFDAIAVMANANLKAHNLIPVATSSTSGARLMRWVISVDLANKVLLAFDDDGAGTTAAAWWASNLGEKAILLRPTQHDITDMVKAGDNLNDWIAEGLSN
jgi:DNA primase